MKVGTDGSHRVRAALLVFLLLPFFLLLSACPPVVTDTIATQSTDKLPPTITITSPNVGSSYTANVTVTGTITDDAVKAGDGLGTVRSIDYSIANDVLRKGKISIADDGTSTQVASYGSGTITWTKATNTFTFTVSTVSPSPLSGAITIIIDATDANGNMSTSTLQLSQGSGPVITISSPTDLKYTPGTTRLTIAGTVANSSDSLTSDDNIASISWGVTGKTWGATAAVVSGTTSYKITNTGLTPTTFFYFDTGTRAFTTTFNMPFINDTVLILTVSATDKNGHTNTTTIDLVLDVSGPQLTLTSATTGLYYSKTHFTPPVIAGNVEMGSGTTALTNMTFQLQTSGSTPYSSGSISVYPTNGTGDTSNYTFDTSTGTFTFLMQGASNSATLLGATGTATVTILAVNSKATTTAQYTILEDSTAPTVTVGSISTSNSNATHTKVGDKITLTFNASDALSGLNGYPAVTIAGQPATVAAPVGNTYTATYTMQSSDSAYDNAAIPYSITATDNAGNPQTVGGTSSIVFYESTPTLSTVSIASNNTHPAWAKNGDKVTLSFTSPRALAAAPTVTIAANSVTASTLSTSAPYIYTAAYTYPTLDNTDTEGTVPFTIDFTDAAGNVGSEVTAITIGSNVTYDRTPPTISSVTWSQTSGWVNIANPSLTLTITTSAPEAAGLTAGAISVNTESGAKISSLTGSGDTYSVTYTATGTSPAAVPGNITESVVVVDEAGNLSTPYTTTPSGNTVGLDMVAPTISSVTWSQTSGWVNIANPSLTLTIHLSASEPAGLTAGAISVNTESGAKISSLTGSGSTYSFTYTATSGSPYAAPGVIAQSIAISDAAGNPATNATNTTPYTITPSGNTVGLDLVAPTISSVTWSKTSGWVNIASPSLTLTITLSAPEAAGLTAGAISVNTESGTKISSLTGSGSTYNVTYTATGTSPYAAPGAIAQSIVISDAAGNPATNATNTTPYTITPSGNTVGIDMVAPTISSVTWSKTSGWVNIANPSFDLTITLSASETGLTAGAISVNTESGAKISSMTGSGTTYSVTYTATGTSPAAAAGAIAESVVVNDAAGNPSTPYTTVPSGNTLGLDMVAPTISSVTWNKTSGWVNIANPSLTLTITLSASETGLTTGAISVNTESGAKISSMTGSGSTYHVTYTATGTSPAAVAGALTQSVVVVDEAGNPSNTYTTPPSGNTLGLDMIAPTISSVTWSKTSGWLSTATPALTLTITLGASETGLTAGAISVNTESGAKISSITGSGTTYSVTYTATGTSPAAAAGAIAESVVVNDAAGNPSTPYTTVPSGNTLAVDVTGPTISSVTWSKTSGWVNIANPSFDLTITLSASETGLTAGAISVNTESGAKISSMTGSGTTYSVTYTATGTSPAAAAGAIAESVVVNDAAGNPSTPYTTTPSGNTLGLDMVAPTISSVTWSKTSGWLSTVTPALTLTITLSASETGLTAGAISVNTESGAKISSMTGSGTTYSVTYTATGTSPAAAAGAIAESVVVNDAAGNPSNTYTTPPSGNTLGLDMVAPTISSVTWSKTSGWLSTATPALTLTITLGASETGLTAGAISVNTESGAKISSMTGSGTTYSVTYTATGTSPAAAAGAIAESVVVNDAAGNPSTPYTTVPSGNTLAVDVTGPTISSVTWSKTSGWVNIANPSFDLTITLSASETGLTAGAISVNTESGAKISSMTGSGTTYSVTYTATGTSPAAAAGAIAESVVVNDAAGNPSTPYTTTPSGNTLGLDMVAPTISSVTWSKTSGWVNIANPSLALTITLGVSETGLTAGAISVNTESGAKISSMTGSGTTYSVTYTATGTSPAAAAGAIAESVVVNDAAGNSSTPYTTTPSGNTLGLDMVAPTISNFTFPTPYTAMTVTFSKGVYDSSGNAMTNNNSVTVVSTAGSCTAVSANVSGSPSAGDMAISYTVGWGSGTPAAGSFTVTPVASKIYDLAGNPATTSGGATITRSITMSYVVNTVTRSVATAVGRVGTFLQSTLFGASAQSAAKPSAEGATSASIDTQAVARMPDTTRPQFLTPLSSSTQIGQVQSTAKAAAIPNEATIATTTAAPAASSPATIAMTPASGPQATAPTSLFAQPTVTPIVSHPATSDSLMPSWWAILIGALAIVLVTFSTWKGLRFIRSRGQK